MRALIRLFAGSKAHTLFVLSPGENLLQQDVSSLSQTVKQRQFSKDEFHYLNVTRVGTSTVYDIFDCIFECLSNPRCFSFNFASSKGEGGKLWCDLLSCDKYRDFREYNENVTSHHFFTMVRPGFWYPHFFNTSVFQLYSKSWNKVPCITMNYFFLF